MIEVDSPDAAATRSVGAVIAGFLVPGDVVVLSGDLGTGKTELAKGVAAALGVTEPVVSPTFTILREYEGDLPVHHLDVYRLERVQEAIDLALDEIVDTGVTLVEWGEGVREVLPPDRLEVRLDHVPDGRDDDRHLRIDPVGPAWADRAQQLATALASARSGC